MDTQCVICNSGEVKNEGLFFIVCAEWERGQKDLMAEVGGVAGARA